MAVKRIQILVRGQAADWYDQAMRQPRNPFFPAVWQRLNDIRNGAHALNESPGRSGIDSIDLQDGSHIYLGWSCPKRGTVRIEMIERH